ncbi:VOC family protein [uncultured Algoriphagus sp.]|uniref:VOC family protein n=1 Tax=uncultured Algoriphagus sp. TaxID=417365 RepID=UPI0030EE88FC|tara:strand:- start:5961 stop:6344 length:384 start_codon:yes stop_codon:yes gene_type:complete
MLKNSKAFSSFSAADLPKSKDFYQDVLGLDIEETEMGILSIHLSGGGEVIIYLKPDHVPAAFTVLNFPVEDIDQAADELISKGVDFEQYTGEIQTDEKGICRTGDGPLIAWFRDPAGNILSILQEVE